MWRHSSSLYTQSSEVKGLWTLCKMYNVLMKGRIILIIYGITSFNNHSVQRTLPARKAIKNGEERRPLSRRERPALMHNDIYPIRTVFWFAQWSIVPHIGQNLIKTKLFQSINRSVSGSVSQLINQWISHSFSRSISQSIRIKCKVMRHCLNQRRQRISPYCNISGTQLKETAFSSNLLHLLGTSPPSQN